MVKLDSRVYNEVNPFGGACRPPSDELIAECRLIAKEFTEDDLDFIATLHGNKSTDEQREELAERLSHIITDSMLLNIPWMRCEPLTYPETVVLFYILNRSIFKMGQSKPFCILKGQLVKE